MAHDKTVALITGANQGIGLQIARELASNGFTALTNFMRDGKICMIGASMFSAFDIVRAQLIAKRRNLGRFRIEQWSCSFLNRCIEWKVLPACRRYGMGVMRWGPLVEGMLTGKYRKGEKQPDSLRVKSMHKAMAAEGSLDAVEQHIPLAKGAAYALPPITQASLRRCSTVVRAAVWRGDQQESRR